MLSGVYNKAQLEWNTSEFGSEEDLISAFRDPELMRGNFDAVMLLKLL